MNATNPGNSPGWITRALSGIGFDAPNATPTVAQATNARINPMTRKLRTDAT
jgi:hypothetical protein